MKAKRILISDDDEGILDAIKTMCEVLGYEVHIVADGNEVMEAVKQLKPDLLLLDIWMSGVDGREVCQQLKADPTTSELPILMISASQQIKTSALNCGANDFLAKPFEMTAMMEKIETLTA
jgi:CheY-like chemotaxis protein